MFDGMSGYFSRRSRKLSIHGTTPGIRYGRSRGGFESNLEHFARVARENVSQNPQDEYDPIRPQYPTAPQYGPPDPWDAIALGPRTPPLRLDWPERSRPHAPTYQTTIAFARVVDRLMQKAHELHEAGEPLPAPLATLFNTMMPYWPGVPTSKSNITATPTAPIGPDLEMAEGLSPKSAAEALALEMTAALDPAVRANPELLPLLTEFGLVPADMVGDAMQMSPVGIPDEIVRGMEPVPLDAPITNPHEIVDAFDAAAEQPDPFDMMVKAFEPTPMSPDSMMAPAPTLDTLVEQLHPGPVMPEPEPDPFLMMNQLFNQHMQMMDPFGPPGPMGM